MVRRNIGNWWLEGMLGVGGYKECWELVVRRNVGSWWLEGLLGVGS